jgi:ribosomal protein S18 acetylase RimI-like enzyme
MLDKSLAYKSVIMKMDASLIASVRVQELPYGYAFRLFADGDETHWARLEASVLELATEKAALDYFVRDYLAYPDQLKQRCVFVINAQGLPIATATAWFADSALGHQPSLQWVSVAPEYQGKGLGRAVVSKAMSLFPRLEPSEDVYLHTQTWSHVAIRLYRSIGFHLCSAGLIAMNRNDDQGVRIYPNEYAGAIEVLRAVMKPVEIDDLVCSAE